MTTNSIVSLTTSKPQDLISEFRKKVSSSKFSIEELALEAFSIHYDHNDLYRGYAKYLNIKPENVTRIDQIPFMPIEFFKSHKVATGNWFTEKVFKSSGTTKTGRSTHSVDSLKFYLRHSADLFESVYGDISELSVMALLPSYQDQGDSSLIAMVDELIKRSSCSLSGYYLANGEGIADAIARSHGNGRQAIVIGVSFALLDLSEIGLGSISGAIVIETGGMKGRRKEVIRKDLHEQLQLAFSVGKIHSEYGMTELLSQAYSIGDGLFRENQWMKCLIRDINDPLSYVNCGFSGGINVIDLANIHSCCFIETKDIGRKSNGETFEVLGRFDNSDIRGCNLLL